MALNWTTELVEQIDWHWQHQLRPRIDSLTDEEYFWEPAPDSWSVRPRGTSAASMPVGSGAYTIDFAMPQPVPAAVTTIAWRLGHIIVGVLGVRTAAHFGGPPCDYASFDYAGTAAGALAQLDDAYAGWLAGIGSLGEDQLQRPCGPAEGPFADLTMATLVLHINRELIHHGAEIALLRDLYLRR